jgi:hypothetical protein
MSAFRNQLLPEAGSPVRINKSGSRLRSPVMIGTGSSGSTTGTGSTDPRFDICFAHFRICADSRQRQSLTRQARFKLGDKALTSSSCVADSMDPWLRQRYTRQQSPLESSLVHGIIHSPDESDADAL